MIQSATQGAPEILAMHGVVEGMSTARFCHRNLLDRSEFVHHLTERPPYLSIAAALAGEGRAITIDDATFAAADAALLAREFGHSVMIFINPYNVLTGTVYFFGILNVLLDRLKPPLSNLSRRRK